VATVASFGLLFIPAGTVKATEGLLWETESPLQYIQVLERPDGSRALKLNEGVVAHSIWYRDSVFTGGEWDMFLVVPPLLGHPVERMLVIGNAGGTIARAYGELYPNVRIDGVEIDAKVTEAGRRFLGLDDNPKLHVVTADGRPFLQLTDSRYDLIVVDAYRQPYIPFYLSTKEFFRLTRERLRPGGVLALNVAAVPGDRRLANAIGNSVRAVYPQAWRWKPLRFSELVLGFDRRVSSQLLSGRVGRAPAAVAPLVPLFREGVEPVGKGGRAMTDDLAPVELLTDRMIIEHIAGGGELDEHPLPTAP
jgi:spermidine synthase